ncbi:hypothetical protein JW766_03075 [Candidatus Dojkabacteria bacterium]|nr:hypothetical protein [Candidatus Dojkabacteria bacterium]
MEGSPEGATISVLDVSSPEAPAQGAILKEQSAGQSGMLTLSHFERRSELGMADMRQVFGNVLLGTAGVLLVAAAVGVLSSVDQQTRSVEATSVAFAAASQAGQGHYIEVTAVPGHGPAWSCLQVGWPEDWNAREDCAQQVIDADGALVGRRPLRFNEQLKVPRPPVPTVEGAPSPASTAEASTSTPEPTRTPEATDTPTPSPTPTEMATRTPVPEGTATPTTGGETMYADGEVPLKGQILDIGGFCFGGFSFFTAAGAVAKIFGSFLPGVLGEGAGIIGEALLMPLKVVMGAVAWPFKKLGQALGIVKEKKE